MAWCSGTDFAGSFYVAIIDKKSFLILLKFG
jgi:hypothetical protein